MSIKQLQDKIKQANYFYRIGSPIIPDHEYDSLVDRLTKIDPDNDLLQHIGFQVSDRKVNLPISMASMNKIKTIGEINDWFRLKNIHHDTEMILTPKYDGLSLCVNETYGLAFTRGDGKVGQVATPHYDKMTNKLVGKQDMQFTYGEAIMPKGIFKDSYSGEFANARNLVSGLFNSKEPSEYLNDCVYIKYGAVGHDYKSKSDLLDRLNHDQEYKVPYLLTTISEVNEDLLKNLFRQWSEEFEIDGLIIEVNDIELQEALGRETSTNNPVWARAIKHKSFENSAISRVKKITWNVSKQGFLKPIINIEPVLLDGVIISNVTGNNARYIKEMGIGVGSEVVVVRSGMVIPLITEVLTKKPFVMPEGYDVTWNENEIELVVKNETQQQILKKVVAFFEILETKGISEGIINQILSNYIGKYHNFKSAIALILQLTKVDLCGIYGFSKKKANSVHNLITSAVTDVDLAKLQHATGLFKNLGSKKLALLVQYESKPTIEEVMRIDGFAQKSAQAFVSSWDLFWEFMEDLPITIKKNETFSATDNDLENKSFCFTGIRLPEIEEIIQSRGGKVASGVSKNTTYLITKVKGSGSTKEAKATQLGIPVVDVEELKKILQLS